MLAQLPSAMADPGWQLDLAVLADTPGLAIMLGGPVGLFLANECARRGLRWRIIEKNSSQSENSKALAIFPRTLEIFDLAAVVGPFLERANRVSSVTVVTHGRTLAHTRFTPEESPYRFVAMVPQDTPSSRLHGS
jgi:2-polyprenyl-6-methoxyphenol hydroxylase-like FAD-dependent oxidoreductase